jgi:hypothetical protein
MVAGLRGALAGNSEALDIMINELQIRLCLAHAFSSASAIFIQRLWLKPMQRVAA